VTGSTSSDAVEQPAPPRRLRGVVLLAATLVAGALTALVFLIRAGSEGPSNWPVGWELRSSDNGVLFQLLQDVAAGRTLDWSFSPQVYVFPELPVSALAFVFAGGDVYVYYLLVAVINNALLFAALLLIVRVLFRSSTLTQQLLRASLAFTPLLVLPLVGTSWLFQYHLAPTYYFGMYLLLIAAPAVFLVRTRAARAALATGIALTAASNPLALVFAFPAFVIVLLVVAFRGGFRTLRRPALLAGAILLAALLVRVLAFAPLQGTSPLSYIDIDIFRERLDALGYYLEWFVTDDSRLVVLVIAAATSVGCLIAAVILGVSYVRSGGARVRLAVWFGLVPLTGLAGTAMLLITHSLYLWPALIAPFVFVLLAVRRRWLPWMLGAGAAGFVILLVVTGGAANLATPERYFGHRSDETRCLDERLPAGDEIGYATFSDARRLSLTSERGFRLIPLKSDGSQAGWLANLDYLHADVGHFFYLNAAGDEPEIDREFIEGTFGMPDEVIECDPDREVWIYSDVEALERIAEHFAVRQR